MLFPGAMQELGGSQEKLLFWLHAKQGKVSFFMQWTAAATRSDLLIRSIFAHIFSPEVWQGWFWIIVRKLLEMPFKGSEKV